MDTILSEFNKKSSVNFLHKTTESILSEKSFKEHKIMTTALIKKLKVNGFLAESARVKNCGSYLLFSNQEHTQTKKGRLRLKKADFCKFRFCPMCQWRRSKNVCRELIAALSQIETERRVAYIFLTFTIKNPDVTDLKKSVKNINQSFKRMIETKAYKKAILGHFKALEVLGSKTPVGEVHPHLHVLCVVSQSYFKSRNYLSQKKWGEMWQKALRVDYSPSVNVKRVYSKKNITALQAAVYEVAKYSIKSTDLVTRSNDDFAAIIMQTYRMRFFAVAGILKINLQKIESVLIDLDKKDNELWIEIEELLYAWNRDNYYLKKIQKIDTKDGAL